MPSIRTDEEGLRPETGETTEEPLFNADEGAFDNFIGARRLFKGETLLL